MASNYPGGLDSFATRVDGQQIDASHVDELGNSIEAIEGALGVNPQGAYATVDARLDAAEAGVAASADAAATAAALALKAPLASPALAGNPTAPTPPVDDDDTSVATTAFVLGQLGAATPLAPGTAAAGTSTRAARQDHVHPGAPALVPGAIQTTATAAVTSTLNRYNATSGALAPALPAVGAAGVVLEVTKTDSSANTVTVGGETLAAAGDVVRFISDGTSWVSGGVRMTRSAATATYAPLQISGSRVVWLGDSITAASAADNFTTPTLNYGEGFTTYLTLASGGAIRHAKNAGVAGNTSTQMLARFDTDVTPYSPTVVHILAGTNDAGASVSIATFASNIRAIVAKCRAIAATPVIGTIPPNTTGSPAGRQAAIIIYNNWLRRYCADQGILLVDYYKALVDPATGGWLSGYNSDGTHPIAPGMIAMANEALASLRPFVKPFCALLPLDALDAQNLVANKLFLGGASGNGLPTGWAENSGLQAGTTRSYVTDPGAVPGNLLRITQAAGTAHYITAQLSSWSVGDTLAVAGLVTSNGGVAAGVEVIRTGGSGTFKMLEGITQAVTRGVWYSEFTVPTGVTALYLMLKAGAGTGTVDYGQLAVYNLTTSAVLTA